METLSIHSYAELQEKLKLNPNAYLLLHKDGSETSRCAIDNIREIKDSEIVLLTVDVSRVRDVHNKYAISSVPALLEFSNSALINAIKGCQEANYYRDLIQKSPVQKSHLGASSAPKRVKVYSTPSCSWCTKIKEYLRSQNIRFTDVDVSKDERQAEAMIAKSGQRGVPQTEINGRMVIGFDKQKIDKLLDLN